VHERLAIVGIGELVLHFYPSPAQHLSDTGAQPLTSQDGKISLTVNGEIYNHIALRAKVGPDVTFKTHSDCEVIIPLV
jgi:asparagine synthase (glutamine-hydrolysing)